MGALADKKKGTAKRRRRPVVLIELAVVAALLVLAVLNFESIYNRFSGNAAVSVDPLPGELTHALVPKGFEVNVFARDLRSPRLMDVGPDGTVYVAEQGGGRITALPDADHNGEADSHITVVGGLDAPNSVVFHDNALIIGEASQISEVTLGADHRATDRRVLVPDLPADGRHTTKTVLVGADGRLYVAMGSSCNVCRETDERRAAVSVYNLDGTGGRVFARGLRNAVGLALNPWTHQIWATDNGTDLMGPDVPPEVVQVLVDGGDYGWPRCHAGTIVDPHFGDRQGCAGVMQPVVRAQAHMAPLGLTFYRDGPFPPPYNNSLYIAFHGSWNRDPKVGYKVMRVPLMDGRVAGEPQDFMTGFLRNDGRVTGRPVGVVVGADGSLLVSDDKGGFIYRVTWKGGQ
jgi:glucose/arabinose dehydrogenase